MTRIIFTFNILKVFDEQLRKILIGGEFYFVFPQINLNFEIVTTVDLNQSQKDVFITSLPNIIKNLWEISFAE